MRILLTNLCEWQQQRISWAVDQGPRCELIGRNEYRPLTLDSIERATPDALMFGVSSSDTQCIEYLSAIRERMPNLPLILILTVSDKRISCSLPIFAKYRVFMADQSENSKFSKQQFTTALLAVINAIKGSNSFTQPVATNRNLPMVKKGILAIGASTGGPIALQKLLSALPGDLGVPVVIVQHMPAKFTPLLSKQLNQICSLEVVHASDGEPLLDGRVYVAPGGRHMRLIQQVENSVVVSLCDDPPVNSCRPSVDVLFDSVAELYGSRCLSVVLTGMGRDGLSGCKALSEKGAQIVVQDEASSVVWGMPGLVANAGLADAIVPLDILSETLLTQLSAHENIKQ